jgi:hypothetical protein
MRIRCELLAMLPSALGKHCRLGDVTARAVLAVGPGESDGNPSWAPGPSVVDILGFELIEDTYVPDQDKRWVVVAPLR